jgi:tRNA modification GTPase
MPTTQNSEPLSGELCCAILTPLGRGAVATVSVRGPGAVAAVGRRFQAASGRSFDRAVSPGSVLVGRFRAGPTAEDLVVGLVGEEEVEVHCHGGVAAVEAVVEALVAEGCRPIATAAWSDRTERNSIAAAARLALAEARTERTAAILLDQYAGALEGALRRILGDLQAGDTQSAAASIDRLLAWKDLGLHLTRSWRIAIAGRPNVGKSSLINALVGYERAIVFDQPGTTRDVLLAAAAFEGWPVELADTAGLRAAESQIEASGVERAQAQISTADLVIYVLDASAPWNAAAEQLGEIAPTRLIVVHNKCDLAPPPGDGRPAGVALSAKTGLGLPRLIATLASRLVLQPPPPGAAIPFTLEQIEVLAVIREYITTNQIARAIDNMAAVTLCVGLQPLVAP